MRGLKAALYDFWAGFDMPAYLQDSVHNGAELPYVTYEVVRPPAFGALPLVAIAWFPPSLDGQLRRTAFQDAVGMAIPEGGVMLPIDGGGCIVLDRNPSGFVSDYQDPEETNIIGARVSYLTRFYYA